MTEPANHSFTAISADGDAGQAWHALCVGELSLPMTFGFACYDTRFDVAVVQNGDDGTKLAVQAQLGALPYSIESMFARQYIKAVVQVGHDLPFAELSLSRKQALTVRGTMEFPNRPTPAIVVASAAVIAIAVKPIIDIISFFRSAGKSAA